MEMSFWKLCDFYSVCSSGTSLLVQPSTSEWRSESFIHSFIHLLCGAPCGGSHSSEGRCGVCLYTYQGQPTVSKFFGKKLQLWPVLWRSHKGCMGTLNRKAWSRRGGSRESFPGVMTFEMARIRWNRTAKRKKPCTVLELKGTRYNLVMSSPYIPQWENWGPEGKGTCLTKVTQPGLEMQT